MAFHVTHTAFGAEDFHIDGRFLSHMAFLCSPDKPVETSTVIGNYAVSEICVSEAEAADIKMYFDTLRSPGQAAYVRKVMAEMRKGGAACDNGTVAEAAEAMATEFQRFESVFFVRVRAFLVIHVESNETVGRIVTFPDQISDDYGNNLEEHSEQGISQSKVVLAQNAEQLPTIYIGHAQGAAMAQLCACAYSRQAIVFDGTTLSELLVHNAVEQKCVRPEPMDEGEKSWHIIHYRTEAFAKKQDATAKATITAARKVDADERAAKAAKGTKVEEEKKTGEFAAKAAQKEEEDYRAAKAWFKKCEWNTVGGIIPAVAQTRFTRTGRYNAKALSDMMVDYTVSMRAAHDPYL
ncbi:hypothetical protein LSCM1_03851 [Leishmania martiniquensis]|uniref:Uncharacterized protein n=1 Tax=Leishmania martiniquensis TaxID=1580590 RepID=A0A836FZX5_9TRYP|nr:hypothetical protein LSCM1_03851 [Leishmania martiniquensis]